MASTGFKFAGTGASVDTGGQPWGDPGNITADDNAFASTAEDDALQSDALRATNFDFSSVPDGSTIDGIEVRYRRRRFGTSNLVASAYNYLVSSGANIGSAKVQIGDWATSEEAITNGTSTDKWNATLTSAIVKSSTFGVDIGVTWGAGLPAGGTGDVDSVEMNVHFTASSGHTNLPLLGVG